MAEQVATMTVQFDTDRDASTEYLAEVMADLRDELSGLDVEDAAFSTEGTRPIDAKLADPLTATLVVTLVTRPELLKAVLTTAQEWITRLVRVGLTSGVRVKLGEDELELSGRNPSPEQLALIREFIDRHANA
jgi:hypothetical protein